MEIKSYTPSDQMDPAVDLGVLPAPLPEIEFLREFVTTLQAPPPQIIEGRGEGGAYLSRLSQ